VRLVFLGTPAFAVPSLHLLVHGGFDLAAVITQPDRPVGRGGKISPPPVKEAALRLGLKVYQPATLRSAEALAHVRGLAPEVVVVVAYGQILRRTLLDVPPLGCINIHPSLLPKLRGASPIQAAIREGLSETGVSIMLMDERMDAGPILSQARFPVFADDTAATLGDRLAQAGAQLLVETLPRWQRREIAPIPQIEADATYCTPLRKEDANVNWTRPAVEIARTCRAQTPWPGCQTFWGDRQLRLFGLASEAVGPNSGSPGTVLVVKNPANGRPTLAVVSGEGAVTVRELQLPGRRVIEAAEFLRGYPSIVGAELTSSPI
jgi:methionyl-tRNA formyltransferase